MEQKEVISIYLNHKEKVRLIKEANSNSRSLNKHIRYKLGIREGK